MTPTVPPEVLDWLVSRAQPLTPAGDAHGEDVRGDRVLAGLADDLAAGASVAAGVVQVVGLGPTTREGAESAEVQADLVWLLVQRGFRTVVLQDTIALGARLDRWVGTPTGVELVEGIDAVLADAWGPWRIEPLRRTLTRIREHNGHHLGVSSQRIEIRGISTTTAVPADYDHVLELTAEIDARDRVAELLTVVRVAHDGGEHTERAHGRWAGPPFVDLARDAREAIESSQELTNTARERALTLMDRIVDYHATSISQGHDPLAEDLDAADHLVRHLATSGRRAVIWDGLAHLLGHGQALGGRLREHLGTGYRHVATTFGTGHLRDFELPAPRPDALEARLEQVAHTVDGAFALDLTGPAPSHVAEWLARTHRVRIISGMYDPSSDEEHYHDVENLGGSIDVLIHLPSLTPVAELK